jgi:hypothetical protein
MHARIAPRHELAVQPDISFALIVGDASHIFPP